MAPGSWQTEWRSRREPLSGYARVIRGERSAPNCVCVTPTLPGNCALRRRMKRETTSAHFPPRGIRRGSGGLHISFFCYYSFVSFDPCRPPPPPPRFTFAPLSTSCIVTSRFKDRPDEAPRRENDGSRGVSMGCMYVFVTFWCQRGDTSESSISLTCQRKSPLTGGPRHHKSSVILSMPLSLSLSLLTFR